MTSPRTGTVRPRLHYMTDPQPPHPSRSTSPPGRGRRHRRLHLALTDPGQTDNARSEQRERDRKFTDSPLERNGFEPSVPGREATASRRVFVASITVPVPETDSPCLSRRGDLAHDFLLEAAAFGFGVDFLDIFAERALLIFEPLTSRSEEWTKRSTTNRRPCSTSTNAL